MRLQDRTGYFDNYTDINAKNVILVVQKEDGKLVCLVFTAYSNYVTFLGKFEYTKVLDIIRSATIRYEFTEQLEELKYAT